MASRGGKSALKLERIPRAEVQDIINWLIYDWLVFEDIFVGGSWIREQPDCGDLDIAILANTKTEESIYQLVLNNRGTYMANGQKLKRIILMYPGTGREFQLDIWITLTRDSWGPLCMFVAGSGRFNVIQRAKATRQGYCLSQYNLVQLGTGLGASKVVDQGFPTERSVYDFLGWTWVPYKDRR